MGQRQRIIQEEHLAQPNDRFTVTALVTDAVNVQDARREFLLFVKKSVTPKLKAKRYQEALVALESARTRYSAHSKEIDAQRRLIESQAEEELASQLDHVRVEKAPRVPVEDGKKGIPVHHHLRIDPPGPHGHGLMVQANQAAQVTVRRRLEAVGKPSQFGVTQATAHLTWNL